MSFLRLQDDILGHMLAMLHEVASNCIFAKLLPASLLNCAHPSVHNPMMRRTHALPS
jgi:hypothetical protein